MTLSVHGGQEVNALSSSFPLFSHLPLELRQQIWRHALSAQWSFSRVARRNRRVRLIGSGPPAAAHACREAREAIPPVHGESGPLGFINFDRHLFFFRDAKYDRQLMPYVDRRWKLLSNIRHMAINPRDWPHFWETVNFVRESCQSLRSLVIVTPWLEPPPSPIPTDQLDLAPYEDWGAIFHKTPAEMLVGVGVLIDAIESGPAAATLRKQQYFARLDEAVAQLPGDLAGKDNAWWRTRHEARKLEQVADSFPGGAPMLYLCRKEELCRPT